MLRTCSGSHPPTALDLADAFIRDCHPSDNPDQRAAIRAIVLAAGELIAARGSPGRWITLDPAELLASIPSATPAEHDELCYLLIAFVTWLAARDQLDIDRLFTTAAVLASGATDPLLSPSEPVRGRAEAGDGARPRDHRRPRAAR